MYVWGFLWRSRFPVYFKNKLELPLLTITNMEYNTMFYIIFPSIILAMFLQLYNLDGKILILYQSPHTRFFIFTSVIEFSSSFSFHAFMHLSDFVIALSLLIMNQRKMMHTIPHPMPCELYPSPTPHMSLSLCESVHI